MKKAIANIRLTLLANKATRSTVLGQALGQYGIDQNKFCQTFNNLTKNIKTNIFIPTKITIFNKNNFDVHIKTPTTTYFLKNSIDKKKKTITPQKLYHLALFKKTDPSMFDLPVKSICRTIKGSAKSMNISVSKS